MNLLAIPALIASVIMISKGADWLTDSIWHISLRKRVSAGMLGMVVAGLMTTLPEVTVSGMASALESGGISMGNAIGSTIFNILGIVGIIGLIRPLDFDKSFLRDFGRNAFVAYMAFFILAIIGRSIDSIDAIILFCVLGASLYYGYRRRYVGAPSIAPPSGTLFRDISIIALGGVVLGVGSYLLVYAARSIAADLGIPEIIIGLSLVAVGTSIPELATGIASTRKGIEEISIGNVLGANIYNVTLVLGCASLIGVIMHDRPLVAENSTLFFDIPFMIGATVLLMILGREGRVSRRISILFLVIYGCYLGITFSGVL
jgi:cation:H+ antiporter